MHSLPALRKQGIVVIQSDFKIVANFFASKRKDPDYVPDDKQTMGQVEDVLWLLSAVTGDNRYRDICYEKDFEEVHTMCDVAQRLEDRGRVSGLKEGIKEGGLIMLYRLVSEGTITIDQAVNAALPYGVKNAEDFRKRAMLAGYNLK